MIPDEFIRFSLGQQSRSRMRNVHGMLEDLTFTNSENIAYFVYATN